MKVLVVVAHPDDEVLGCGATIVKHSKLGHEVFLLTMSDGVSSRGSKDGLKERLSALEKSCSILGISKYKVMDFLDNKLDQYPLLDLIQSVENDLLDFNPDIIYTHSATDLNVDHRITNSIVFTIFRPIPNSSVQEIRSMEVPSGTHWGTTELPHFAPNLFIDATNTAEKKIEALKIYGDELRAWPHARSLEATKALLNYRGSLVGLDYAEAFHVDRRIIK